jgi:hypothetical protein
MTLSLLTDIDFRALEGRTIWAANSTDVADYKNVSKIQDVRPWSGPGIDAHTAGLFKVFVISFSERSRSPYEATGLQLRRRNNKLTKATVQAN